MDRPVAGDHAVAEDLVLRQAEVGGAVGDELIDLDEAARIAAEHHPLARGQLSRIVLALGPRRAARLGRLPLQGCEALEPIAVAHARWLMLATPAAPGRIGGARCARRPVGPRRPA